MSNIITIARSRAERAETVRVAVEAGVRQAMEQLTNDQIAELIMSAFWELEQEQTLKNAA